MKFKQKSISSNDVRLHQAGLTLLELIISISIMMLVSVGMVQLADKYSEDVKTAVIADQLKRTGDAARSYIKDNYATIAATATSVSPYQITAAMLAAGGYLPTSSVSSNGYGQSVCTLVLQPSANKLQAMVVTEGGTTVDDLTLGDVVKLTGSSSGAILSSAPTVISGAMGGWSIPVATWHNKVNNLGTLCDGTTAGNVQVTIGHPALALWFEDSSYQSNALYRDSVPGQPQLNTMNTPIVMGAGTIQTVGAACTPNGMVGRDADGAVLSCKGGIWKGGDSGLNWKGSVASFASLPASGNTSGDAYRIASLSNHVFVWDTQASVWQGLVVNSSGNLSLPGLIYTAGSNSNYGAITMQGAKNGWSGINFKDTAGSNAGTLMMHPSYSGFYNAADNNWRMYVDNAGNMLLGDQSGPDGSMKGTLNPGWAVETWGCSSTGAIAKAAYTVADGWAYNGKTLSCQSGVWKMTAANSSLNSGSPGSVCAGGVYCNRNSGIGACLGFDPYDNGGYITVQGDIQWGVWGPGYWFFPGSPWSGASKLCHAGVIWYN